MGRVTGRSEAAPRALGRVTGRSEAAPRGSRALGRVGRSEAAPDWALGRVRVSPWAVYVYVYASILPHRVVGRSEAAPKGLGLVGQGLWPFLVYVYV